jgi:hypothetical protein
MSVEMVVQHPAVSLVRERDVGEEHERRTSVVVVVMKISQDFTERS